MVVPRKSLSSARTSDERRKEAALRKVVAFETIHTLLFDNATAISDMC